MDFYGIGKAAAVPLSGHVFFTYDRRKTAQCSDFHSVLHEMPNQNIMIFIITISEDFWKVL